MLWRMGGESSLALRLKVFPGTQTLKASVLLGLLPASKHWRNCRRRNGRTTCTEAQGEEKKKGRGHGQIKSSGQRGERQNGRKENTTAERRPEKKRYEEAEGGGELIEWRDRAHRVGTTTTWTLAQMTVTTNSSAISRDPTKERNRGERKGERKQKKRRTCNFVPKLSNQNPTE